jgi:hypothetical protein
MAAITVMKRGVSFLGFVSIRVVPLIQAVEDVQQTHKYRLKPPKAIALPVRALRIFAKWKLRYNKDGG